MYKTRINGSNIYFNFIITYLFDIEWYKNILLLGNFLFYVTIANSFFFVIMYNICYNLWSKDTAAEHFYHIFMVIW